MKRKLILILALLLLANACDYGEERTCCDGKGGVAYCDANGDTVCGNGQKDYSCPCKK